MPHNNQQRQSITNDDALRSAFALIGEPCSAQPAIYPAARHGVRSPWSPILKYFMQAFDAAGTREKRRAVVERIIGFLYEAQAHVRVWLWTDGQDCRREVFESAQDADGQEDMAETVFLMESTPANRARLIEAGRLERMRSEQRERYLLGDGRPAA